MPTRVFQLFVRRFPQVGYSAHVLGEPHLASFGESMPDVYSDLTKVCGRLLDRGALSEGGALQPFTLRRVDLTLRALQRGRLLDVPMRFTVLLRTDAVPVKGKPPRGPVRIVVPRLELEHTLQDSADFDGFVEEIIATRCTSPRSSACSRWPTSAKSRCVHSPSPPTTTPARPRGR